MPLAKLSLGKLVGASFSTALTLRPQYAMFSKSLKNLMFFRFWQLRGSAISQCGHPVRLRSTRGVVYSRGSASSVLQCLFCVNFSSRRFNWLHFYRFYFYRRVLGSLNAFQRTSEPPYRGFLGFPMRGTGRASRVLFQFLCGGTQNRRCLHLI